jgi:hypothetical protein
MLVRYNKPNIWHIGDAKFITGVNEITPELWDSIKDHPLAKKRIDQSIIEIISAKKEDRSDTMLDMSEKKAISLVGECYDVVKLREWLNVEKRYKVQKAIDEQIAKILAPSKKKENTEEVEL